MIYHSQVFQRVVTILASCECECKYSKENVNAGVAKVGRTHEQEAGDL